MLRLATFAADVLALLSGAAAKALNNVTIGAVNPASASFTTLALTGSQGQAAVLAAPAGAAGAPTFRTLGTSDVAGVATAASVTAETSRAQAAEGLLAPKASPSFTGNVSTSASNSGGNGLITVTNPFTAAGTNAVFQAVTGTPNANVSVVMADGATPIANITTGTGVTGGLVISAAAGGVAIPSALTLASATFGSSLGAKINLYGTPGAVGSYGLGINSGELTAWTSLNFALRQASATAGLSGPVMFMVGSNGNTTINTNTSGGAGYLVLNNPYSAAGTVAQLLINTGTANAFTSIATGDGATPTGYISTGSGVTGGLLITPAVLGVTINDPAAGGIQTLALNANSNTNGCNLKMAGNGATTPNKYLRALNGVLQILNHGYSTVILGLTDAGALSLAQSVSAPTHLAGGGVNSPAAGVAWSGTGNGYSATNTTTGTTVTGTNYTSIVSATATAMRHMAFSVYNGTTYTAVGSINSNAATTTYATTSDYRLKQGVTPLEGSAARIAALRPCAFTFVTDPARTLQHGFIAHEFAEALPDAGGVSGLKDDTQDLTGAVLLHGHPIACDVSEAAWREGRASGRYEQASEWYTAVTVPCFQGLDASKCLPDLVATVQDLLASNAALAKQVAELQATLLEALTPSRQRVVIG